jgi:hypothetical protein
MNRHPGDRSAGNACDAVDEAVPAEDDRTQFIVRGLS